MVTLTTVGADSTNVVTEPVAELVAGEALTGAALAVREWSACGAVAFGDSGWVPDDNAKPFGVGFCGMSALVEGACASIGLDDGTGVVEISESNGVLATAALPFGATKPG